MVNALALLSPYSVTQLFNDDTVGVEGLKQMHTIIDGNHCQHTRVIDVFVVVDRCVFLCLITHSIVPFFSSRSSMYADNIYISNTLSLH